MAYRDIIVVGASAGGIEAARQLVAGLPGDLPATVFVVVHIPPYAPSGLGKVLRSAGVLPVSEPHDGQIFRRGTIYVAPPDHHLLIEDGSVVVRRGPKENRFRPSVDALFRSAAYTYGPRVIGIVLSGALDDGASGLWSIKRLGGIAIAQRPVDAQHPEMPQSAIENVEVDHVVSAAEIGPLIARLVAEQISTPPPAAADDEERRELGREIDLATHGGAFDRSIVTWGDIAPFGCPECHGALVRIEQGPLLRFRCVTGHAFTPRALLAGITEAVAGTLASAIRGLEEQSSMFAYLSEQAERAGRGVSASMFSNAAQSSTLRARDVQRVLPAQHQLADDILRDKPV